MTDFCEKKNIERDDCTKLQILHVSIRLNFWWTIHCVRAIIVVRAIISIARAASKEILKIWKKFRWFYSNKSWKCHLHVDAFDRFEQQSFHLLYQNMISWTHDCILSVNRRHFFWKDERSQISVRIWCMPAKHCGRILMGQTGKWSKWKLWNASTWKLSNFHYHVSCRARKHKNARN